ncbi:ESX secretion-associated protein EspG [Saccharothrix coeruleofusca]|uniref:ESX secretion-associated protein EspG n=1 Tax=Saccharothrix coeruleofusca TaxID=33919 RepID=A0A918ARC8_9PSEU|nr:ESX secretion-associated protein EspG [Saccharothrix coeruleofusca]GGP73159.1 ESX secretion-associated protein EspG [Saccharothrix coeruleofusca]
MNAAITLSLPEFDVLWEDLRAGAVPYPFGIAQHGLTLDERARIRADVHAGLERRGLVRRGGPEPELANALRLLAEPEVRITVMGMPDAATEELLRALVAARGGDAVLAVQRGDVVRLEPLRDVSLAAAAVSVLPRQRPGPGRPVTVPASALGPRAPREGFARPVRGSADDDVRALLAMLAGPITGTGHFSVTVEGRPPAAPVSWIDTPRGRYAGTGREWLTVAPADHDGLARRISQALAPTGR